MDRQPRFDFGDADGNESVHQLFFATTILVG